jgi:hypothetical protein
LFFMNKEDFYARTMHTPDDPARAEMRAALREMSRHLLPLHRALIESARADYALMVAPVNGPSHLLQLLNEDPYFGWLKPMTSLIVDIDEMARVDFTPAGFEAVAARVDKYFGNTPDAEFAGHYGPILQRYVDVALAHAALRQILTRRRK